MNEIGSEVVKDRYIRGVSSRVEEGGPLSSTRWYPV